MPSRAKKGVSGLSPPSNEALLCVLYYGPDLAPGKYLRHQNDRNTCVLTYKALGIIKIGAWEAKI